MIVMPRRGVVLLVLVLVLLMGGSQCDDRRGPGTTRRGRASGSKQRSCTPRRGWQYYTQIDIKKQCSGMGETSTSKMVVPFNKPIDCHTRNVIEDMALSISNQVFQCTKWCVFSITEDDLAWIYDTKGECFVENRGCFDFKDEVAASIDQKSQLCPAKTAKPSKSCLKLEHPRSLSPLFIKKKKCPAYHFEAKPILHNPIVCETAENDHELSTSVATGAFSDCKNWCIYSLKYPRHVAWFWKPEHDCWTANNTCTTIQKEVDYVLDMKQKLCTPPCSPARNPEELDVSLVSQKCADFDPVRRHPHFHKPNICHSNAATQEGARDKLELQKSLANFAYAECKNWCVYSIDAPRTTWWLWSPEHKCWDPQGALCKTAKEEISYVENLRHSLCLEPTQKYLSYRQIQHPTPIVEDTGLVGDPASRATAYECYMLFAQVMVATILMLIFIQLLVPPQDQGGDAHRKRTKKKAQ